jgi:hypothetical protein
MTDYLSLRISAVSARCKFGAMIQECLAAALQALAVRIVGADEVRRDIIDIAAELEGADG